jgi:TatD DNase family protein
LKVESYKEKQKVDFIKQIELAIKYDKPLMLHIRDGEVKGEAFTDAYNILSKYVDLGQGLSLSGNVHFFTGKLDIAQKFIALGFTVSFTGLITYVRDFDKVIRELPLENIQAETDAPYVAPVPYRGQRNEPAYVIEIYKRIAEIRGEDPETVRVQLLKNAKRVFHL